MYRVIRNTGFHSHKEGTIGELIEVSPKLGLHKIKCIKTGKCQWCFKQDVKEIEQ
jgi:hypothetical protein